jgi:hypothetical protein
MNGCVLEKFQENTRRIQMVDKFRELRRRRKRRYESRRRRNQEQLLNAKKETLRKLDALGRCPAWIKAEKGI